MLGPLAFYKKKYPYFLRDGVQRVIKKSSEDLTSQF